MKKSFDEDDKAAINSEQLIVVKEFSEVFEIFEPVIKLCNEKLAQSEDGTRRQEMQEAIKCVVQRVQNQIRELPILESYEAENTVQSSEDTLPLMIEHKSFSTTHFAEMHRTYNRYSYLEIATIAKCVMNNLGYDFPNQFEIVSNLQQFSLFVTNRLHSEFIDPLFIIYNDTRYDDHWILICITRNEDWSFLSLYKDSKYPEVIEEIQKVLLSKGVRFLAHSSTEQDDANSCGPMALRNMEIMISGLGGDKQSFIQNFAEGKKNLFVQQSEVQQIRRNFSKLIETEVSSVRLETINELNTNGGEKMKANNTTTNSPVRTQAAEAKDTNSEIRTQSEILESLRQATEDAVLEAALKASLESVSTPAKTAGSNKASVSVASNKTPEQVQREVLESFMTKEEKDAIEAALRASLESVSTPAKTAGSDKASVSVASSKTPEQVQREVLESFMTKEEKDAIEAAEKASLESVSTPTKTAGDNSANVSVASNKTPEQLQREILDALTETSHEQEILARVLRISELDTQTLPPPPNPHIASNNIAPQTSTLSEGPTLYDMISLHERIKTIINKMNFSLEKKEGLWKIISTSKDVKEVNIPQENLRMIFEQAWDDCYSVSEVDDMSVMGDL